MDHGSNFARLTENFEELILRFQENDENKELNIILNDLNSLNYSSQNALIKEKSVQLLTSFAKIPSSAETIIIKSACLSGILFSKQKVILPNREFKKFTEWVLKCLYTNFENISCDLLSLLQVLFKNHPEFSSNYWDVILSTDGRLLSFMRDIKNHKQKRKSNDTQSPEEIVRATVSCIDSMLYISDDFSDGDKLIPLGNIIIELLISNEIKFVQSIPHLNFLVSALNILNKIVLHNKDWYAGVVGELLGISRAFMLLGIPGIPDPNPQKVHISQQTLMEPIIIKEHNKGGKVAKTRKPRTVSKSKKSEPTKSTVNHGIEVYFEHPFHHRQQTSDSDFSETEYSKIKNENHKRAKIRLSAISLIGLVSKFNGNKNLYGYWHSLFPSERQIPYSLLTCSIRDPQPRCRIAALQAASVLIFGSKVFLWQAENNDKISKTFTPFSISLGNMILIMYEQLTHALANENSIPVLTQSLKCLSLLIQATPFHRMKTGFVPLFLQHIKSLVHHKDQSVQVASLMVMEFLVSSPGITKEISNLVEIPTMGKLSKHTEKLDEDLDEEYLSGEESEILPEEVAEPTPTNNNYMPWLLEVVVENFGVCVRHPELKRTTKQVSIRIESLQVLTALCKHFQMLKDHLSIIAIVLQKELYDPQDEVRIYTAKCLDTLAHEMSNYLEIAPNDIEDCLHFWRSMLPSVITIIQDPSTSHVIKSSLCDFFSNIGVNIFEKLDHSDHMKLVELLSGVSCSEEPTVKSASVRVLAVYALFPSMKGNLCFVENTAELILPLMKESNIFVRVRASWSLGNISESLLTNSSSNYDRLSDYLLQRLLQSTKESTSDNDKVKSNAVRTLGNLLGLILEKHLESASWKKLILECIDRLVNSVKTGNNAKVKWNACYAIGSFLRNQNLFISKPDFNWQKNVFDTLSFTTINNVNFKVRITASGALQKIENRQFYGNNFIPIWKSLILAMEQSEALVDFNEYNHRDNLQEQLSFSFCHFLNLADSTNLQAMAEELQPRKELVNAVWVRVLNRILPENAGPLLSTAAMLHELSKQNSSIKLLSDCFCEPRNDFL